MAALQGQFNALNSSMAAARSGASRADRPDLYKQQLQSLKELQQVYRMTAMASGDFHVQTVKSVSASQQLTAAMQQNKVSAMQAFKEIGKYQTGRASALREAIREQQLLKGAMSSQMTGQAFGPNKSDLLVPKTLVPQLESARVKYGMINQMISAAARNTINWGKNTQWAGRQITVGMTMPLLMVSGLAATIAYKTDKQLTDIARVYDTTATSLAGQEAELAQMRETSLRDATAMTQQYGVAVNDVLTIQAKLAATGLNGNALQQYTRQTMRVATLGDFDPEMAADMTVSLTTAFRDQIKTVDDLAEVYDFYNVMAQETSVQMEDMAMMIPRAASALSALGVSAQEAGVLMTAMRESGVDPAVGANALKSATATLLNPSKEAIEYWKTALGKDLPAIVEQAGGNLFEFLKQMGEELHGLDPQVVQTAVVKTFGKYQFDRATALITNFGDAMTGTMNQTKTSMDLLGDSAEDLAAKSAQELDRLQQSVSFKFKAAINGVKAALIPLGEAALNLLTPILGVVEKLISGFTSMSPIFKNTLMVLAIGGAIVGPLLMLVGIFANLMGNVVRAGTAVANLAIRFRAQSAEEAAQAITARNASRLFDTEARSAATLATTIAELTAVMRTNAEASATMAAAQSGTFASAVPLSARPAGTLTPIQQRVARQSTPSYFLPAGPGGQNLNPGARAAAAAMAPTMASITAMQRASGPIAENAAATSKSFQGIGRNMGMIAGLGLMAFPLFAKNADGANDSFINIAMIAGTLLLIFPGLIGSLIRGAKLFGVALAASFSGPAVASFFANMKLVALTGLRSGPAAMGATIGALAPKFASVAMGALKIFGPIGILAGGAILVKNIISDMNAMEERQRALATSAESWANAIGYSYVPGVMPGMTEDDLSDTQKAANLADKMAEANEGLADALGHVDDEGEAYTQAMRQVIRALQSGASVEQAAQVFQASLQMMDIDSVTLDRLMVRFENVDLADPDRVGQLIHDQIQNAYDDATEDIVIRPTDDKNDSAWDTVTSVFREVGGGDLTGEARTLGNEIGGLLADALRQAGENVHVRADMFEQAREESAEVFDDMFQDAIDTNGLRDRIEELGITTADQLIQLYHDLDDKGEEGRTEFEENLFHDLRPGMNTDFAALKDSYGEWMDVFIQGLVDADYISQSKGDEIRDGISTIIDAQDEMLGQDIPGTIPIEEAETRYQEAITAMLMAGQHLSDSDLLTFLNQYRSQAGLPDATSLTQAFGAAADDAAGAVEGLGDAMGAIVPTPDDYVNALQSSMGDTMNDVYAQAESLMDAEHDATLEGMRNNLDSRMDHYDDLMDASDSYYDDAEKANDKYWDDVLKNNEKAQDAETAAAEAYWDGREAAIQNAQDAYEAAADARIDALQSEIDAEQDAEADRQKIFEAEQRRIQRMAERLNTNIDFNMALNSGDLDSAARISNDVSAKESGWNLEDQQRTMSEASAERVDSLQSRIDDIEKEKEARKAAFDAQMDQVKLARDAALSALKERQQAESDALEQQKQFDQDRLQSARDTARAALEDQRDSERQRLEATIASTQKQFETDKQGLAMRLRVLQEFTPQNEQELNEHIGRVEALYAEYGINLQAAGDQWAGYIGRALAVNVDAAAAGLQNQINWRQIAANIAAQIGEGMGLSLQQVQEFLRTGQFPAGAAPTAPAYVNQTEAARREQIQFQNRVEAGARHTGGPVPYTAGGFSQKDRTGVPRSAKRYPSETTILAKAGEYVVPKNAANKHRDALDSISQGGDPWSNDKGGPIGSSIMDFALATAAGGIMSATMVAGMVAREKINRGYAEYQAAQQAAAMGGFSSGTLEGGNAPWQRLWNTIKRNFPDARLNDSVRPGASDYHGAGMAVDLGWSKAPGGTGNPYMASMNRWIYDNFHGSTELIYNGSGDDRPNLKNGADFAYSASLQAQHRNHVHWAMTPAAIAAAGVQIASGGVGGGPAVSGGSVQAQVNAEAQRWGYGSGPNWDAINWVVSRESSWNPNAQNATSTASGLFQHVDGTWNAYKRPGVAARKMRLAPIAEQAWAGMNYFKGRYGSPVAGRAFWERNHWYDDGGYLQPGMTAAMNGTRKPEPVFTAAQWDVLKANIGNATYDVPSTGVTPVRVVNSDVATGGQTVYDINIDLRGALIKEELDIQSAVEKAIDVREARNGRRRVIGG